MIREIASTAIAMLVAGQPAFGASQCMSGAEKKAFDVRALQSQLMIAALACGNQSEFNVFARAHRRDLADAYAQITAYFARLYGPTAGERERDRYITELANTQSHLGIRQGGFCSDIRPLVMEALHLRDIDAISRFVSDKNVTNAYSLGICGMPSIQAYEARR